MNTIPAQQQIFKRMLFLTYLSGVSTGLLVAVFVLMLNDLEAKHQGAFPLDAPLITDGLLPLLGFTLIGVVSILLRGRTLLRGQLLAFPPTPAGLSASQKASGYLIGGLTGFGLAVVQLIGVVLSLDFYHANWPLITLIVLLCSSMIVWLLHRLNHHRSLRQ